jgi:hypothetical protein
MTPIDVSPELHARITALRKAQKDNIHGLPEDEVVDPMANATIAPEETSDADVVDAAVSLLEVHWISDENDRQPVPKHAFRKLYSDVPADPQVRQRSAKEFDLTEPFVFTGERHPGDTECPTWVVAEKPESTDFASIPGFLTWLVPRYGRHTMAALIHDHLQDLLVDDPEAEPRRRNQRTVTSTEADYIMRIAMRDLGVPFVLRWIMWSGISMRTLVLTPSSDLDGKPSRKVHPYYAGVVGLWLLLYGVIVGVVGLGWLITLPIIRLSGGQPWTIHPLTIAAVLLSPFLLSLLWLPRWRTGVIAAYTVMGTAMPVVFIFASRSLYWLAELVAKLRPKYTVPVGDDLVVFEHNPISEAQWVTARADRDTKLNQTTAPSELVIDLDDQLGDRPGLDGQRRDGQQVDGRDGAAPPVEPAPNRPTDR